VVDPDGPPLLDPPLEDPPLLDPPLEDPPLDDPPLDEPPLEDPPELDDVVPGSSSVGSVVAGAFVGSGALTVSTVQATRIEPIAANESGRSRRMKHSLERERQEAPPTKLDLHPFKPTTNFLR
jgi:hypothetical protein